MNIMAALWDYKRRYEAEHGAESYHPLLLLMGDGAYDNRKVSQDWSARDFQLTEFLLTYQSENSTNVYSYSTDDYFGLLTEGQRGVGVGAQTLSVGIGRLHIPPGGRRYRSAHGASTARAHHLQGLYGCLRTQECGRTNLGA